MQVVKATASTPLNTLVCRQASSTLPLEETLMKPFMILSAANLLLFRARIIFPMHVEGEHFVCRAVGGSKVGLLLRVCSLPFPYHQCPVNNVHPLLYSHNMCMCISAFVCLPKSCWLHQQRQLIIFQHYAAVGPGLSSKVHIGLIFDEHVWWQFCVVQCAQYRSV